jgi:hypothetical protein
LERKTDVSERRAHPRHTAEIEVQGRPGDGGAIARMVTRDLSLGGLYCSSTTDFPEMTRLAVRLLLPPADGEGDPTPIDLEAVVVRREKRPAANGHPRYELALFFTRLTGPARERLRFYLHGMRGRLPKPG